MTGVLLTLYVGGSIGSNRCGSPWLGRTRGRIAALCCLSLEWRHWCAECKGLRWDSRGTRSRSHHELALETTTAWFGISKISISLYLLILCIYIATMNVLDKFRSLPSEVLETMFYLETFFFASKENIYMLISWVLVYFLLREQF